VRRRTLIFLEHDFGGFDDDRDGVADFEPHFVGAAAGDDAVDFVVSDFDDGVGHDRIEFEIDNFSTKLVACGDAHGPILHFRLLPSGALRIVSLQSVS